MGIGKVFWSALGCPLDFSVIPWWWWHTHHLCLFARALFPSYLGVWVFDNLWSSAIKNSAARITMDKLTTIWVIGNLIDYIRICYNYFSMNDGW
jgi:hypothetical protein